MLRRTLYREILKYHVQVRKPLGDTPQPLPGPCPTSRAQPFVEPIDHHLQRPLSLVYVALAEGRWWREKGRLWPFEASFSGGEARRCGY